MLDRDQIESRLIDDLMDGESVRIRPAAMSPRNYSIADLIDDRGVNMLLNGEDVVNLILHPEGDTADRAKKVIRGWVEEFVQSAIGQDVVNERLADEEEEAREQRIALDRMRGSLGLRI